jgi:hypothetical protein
MNATTRTIVIVTLLAIAGLLLLFGGGMVSQVMMSGGMMGGARFGAFGWMWIPSVLVVVFGVMLYVGLKDRD